jgi:hypothetical protein
MTIIDVDLTIAGQSAQTPPRPLRRLSDKIRSAFHHACDQGDLEIADWLLQILEQAVTRPQHPDDVERRRCIETLVASHERLWHLRHPGMSSD